MDDGNLPRLLYDLRNRSGGTIAFESGFILLVIITAFFGNLLIIGVICKNPRLRTVTNMFLVGLSISDILTASLVMPFTASIFIHGKWMFNDAACIFQGVFVLSLVWISLHMVTLMAINRYFCVIRPRLYRKWFTRRFTAAMITVVSVLPFILTISPYLSGLVTYIFRPGKAACFMTFDPERKLGKIAYTFFLLIIYTILPMTIIAVCYYKVFRMVKQHARAAKNTIRSRQAGTLSSEEVRMTKMLLVLVLGFVFCWVPVIIVDFLNAIMGTGSLPRAAYVTYILFALFSSCINPIVCLALNGKIRREAKQVLCFGRLRQVADAEQTIETNQELTIVRVMPGHRLNKIAGEDSEINSRTP
ncbi:melatonin receptor [Desmophyllum pertusum]|uniref:Melatonin receptor n=1 Tax=Desmophyllum pertusum TaxID=174260 RepID=A0A9X0D8U5_9CNID|nr:melatonin receptor [Desmophyllum pertusum]